MLTVVAVPVPGSWLFSLLDPFHFTTCVDVDTELEKIREQRLKELKEKSMQKREQLSLGHGEYRCDYFSCLVLVVLFIYIRTLREVVLSSQNQRICLRKRRSLHRQP